jgi:hypothetical protein
MVIAQSIPIDVICAKFQKPFKYQMNQQNLIILATCGDKEERKKKKPRFRKMLHSKYGFIHC